MICDKTATLFINSPFFLVFFLHIFDIILKSVAAVVCNYYSLCGFNTSYFLFSIDTSSSDEGSAGEVSVQVDLYTHPGTGEHKVTVKGKEGKIELIVNSVLLPFVDLS
jgi:hypothetical protein